MKSHNNRVLALAIFVFAFSTIGISQETSAHKTCGLILFDSELREAVSKGDAGKVSLLMSYPLRVNDARGTYYLRDVASLQGRFNEIFTPAVRRAVTSRRLDSTTCEADTFMYGNGEVWVSSSAHGYAISTVNVSQRARREIGSARLEFACRTDEYRVLIDKASDGTPRFRAWNKGRSLSQEPNTELVGGKKDIEGTGGCSHSVWSFRSGVNEFVVQGLGCYADSNEPPAAAIGQFSTDSGQQKDEWWWCF
jgi:hypothetical protein